MCRMTFFDVRSRNGSVPSYETDEEEWNIIRTPRIGDDDEFEEWNYRRPPRTAAEAKSQSKLCCFVQSSPISAIFLKLLCLCHVSNPILFYL